MHEKICRGSDALTRTCPVCDKQFGPNVTDETIWQHRRKCTPPAAAPPQPSSSMWKCPKCKSRCRTSFQLTHEAHCRGSVIENKTCSKCKALLQSIETRLKHEELCQGSELANRTCSNCSKICGGFSSRIAHEKKCTH